MVVLVVLLYVIRLVQIQLIDTRYRNSADNNALYYRTVYPTRGVIYDRQGRMIVSNQPSFDVTVVMRNVRNLDTLALCHAARIPVTPLIPSRCLWPSSHSRRYLNSGRNCTGLTDSA